MSFHRSLAAALLASAAIVAPATASLAQQTHVVFFALGSARLDGEAQAVLDRAAAEHASTGSTAVSIVGHTDTTGSASFNERLSQRRADAVAAALADRGVPMASMTTAWRGESELAVQTGDNVAERQNRRAEIAFGGAEAPAASPMLPAAEASRFSVGLGPFVAANLQDGDNSIYTGVNLTVAYAVTDTVDVSAEQAAFYNFDADDEGFGARSVVGLDWTFFDFDGLRPYIGANGGYTWVDGSGTGGWTYGPELGFSLGNWNAKVAYDFLDNRDAEDGVIAGTVSYLLRF
jgi:hypothetical protein